MSTPRAFCSPPRMGSALSHLAAPHDTSQGAMTSTTSTTGDGIGAGANSVPGLAKGMVFKHERLSQRVSFGSGLAATHIAEEVHRLGAQRIMLICSRRDRELSERLTAGLPIVCLYDNVVEHVPVEVVESARNKAANAAVDAVISIGGGSATGLAKAIALTTGLRVLAVPTTYAGSEATNVWGITTGRLKETGADNTVLPVAVIYDAALVLTLPPRLSITSGINALAHCIDALWAPKADPINAALASEGMQALFKSLYAIAHDPEDLDARELSQVGAYLAGTVLASAGAGMHHKLCHVLGGTFNLPHAETHAVVLPHVVGFNAPYALQAARRITQAFPAPDASSALRTFYDKVRAPRALRDLGFEERDIPEAVERALKEIPANNPRPVTEGDLMRLMTAAWAGENAA